MFSFIVSIKRLQDHIAVDGVSVEVILADLATYYRGESPPPLEISSFEFWKNCEQLKDTKIANSYWCNLLTQSTCEIQLPHDFPKSAQQQTQGETVYRPLSHKTRNRVNEIAQNNDVTPFMVYLAAFTILLNRYSRQEDFNLGTVSSGRLEGESERLVGMLVNTLPLRIQLNPNWTFSHLLKWIKKEVLTGLDHQAFSFEDLVTELKSDRESWRNPLFNVLFSRVVSGPLPFFGSEISLQKQDWSYPTAKFDLTLFVLDEADCSRVAVEFASDVLVRASAERILNHYLQVLENIMINSDEPIKAISFLPESEKQQVLNIFNDTSIPYDRKCLIHQLFELQASKTPNALAVQQGIVSYTYFELEMRANRLASSLRKSGVTQGVPVLMIADRTPEMIVAVIAVLKAGGFYVPVETDIPEKRLLAILETLQISHALTDQLTLLESKIDDPKFNMIKKIICIDSDLSQEPSERLSSVAVSQDLAYVIFTSGSTGTPKGVKVAHRPVINLIEWVNRRYAVGNHDKLLFITSLCFDLSVYDIFGTLAAGGTIRVAHGSEIKDPQRLAQIVKDEKITFWDSAPGAIQQILQVVSQSNTVFYPYLRLVFLSGDWVPVSVPGALKKLSPEVLVVALGGATEATVWSNYFEVQEDCSNWESIPYGNPIQNARYYILDELNQPSPIGVPGRLFIGGECLAEGYVGQPKLTEDRFIADPFNDTLGAVIYHTGDLACWRPDGKMRFLGREDHQVKIRGYRVELGEITHSLRQHSAILEAITLAQPDPAGQKALVAYVLSHHQISSHELSNFLATRLPAYMIPSWYSFLEEFPVTQNGKFDLKQLPSIPDLIAQQNDELKGKHQDITPAMSEIEKYIHNLWCQILNRTVVPMEVSFHRAGGNSLLLVSLHKSLEAEWPGFFTIPDLFVIATISAQANHVLNRRGLKLLTLEAVKPPPSEISDAQSSESSNEPIAIIGMAGKWPGADHLMDFWKLNMEGIPQTRPFPTSRQKKVQEAMKSSHASVMQVGSFFDQIEEFDPEFFGVSVREAELMDPVQRQFLSIAWLAFEDAHYPLPTLKEQSVGVYVGYCVGSEDLTYGHLIRENYPDLYPMAFTGNLPPIIASRVSYLYDLRGPSLVIDTACSSSLVAVHQACQALHQNDCEMALVGGVKFHLLPIESHDSIGIESKDGMTRAFAGGSFGTGIGEGVAAVVLKPLSKALRDQDEIYATIVGTACNQDGLTSGLTVPSTVAQQAVIEQAWVKAEKHNGQNSGDFHLQIGCVEAHGTGTQLGDPIEFEALSRVFKKRAPNLRQHCAVGSVKSLVGHLDSAAGITGLIRATLMVKKGIILPSLHFIQPNDKIDYLSSALYVNDLPAQWPTGIRHCGISSFGMSGTNCHVVLKEPPKLEGRDVQQASDFSDAMGVIMLSAHSLESLRRYIKVLRAHLIDYHPLFGALLRSLSTRHHFEFRVALLSDSTERTIQLLSEILVVWPNVAKVGDCEVSFGDKSLVELAGSHNMDSAHQLAQKYVRKDSLDWGSVYRNFIQCRLPGYVFDTRELWFSGEPPLAPKQEVASKPSNDSTAEQTARSLWKSILGTSHISDDMDFFQGGGDSLRAIFFISRLSNVLGLKINPAQLWITPTLELLLEYIRTKSQEDQEDSYTLEATETLASYPLTPAQKYIYVHSILNNDVLYNVPIGLKLMGPLNLELLKKHLTSIIDADLVFSLTFESQRGKVVQTLGTKDENNLDRSSRLQFEVFQCPEVFGQDGSALQKIMTTFIRPFNICEGPLARFAVVRKSDQEHILLMDFHHLIMDGVSVSIFVKRLYQAYKSGTVASSEFAFTDFICGWEKQRIRNGFDEHHRHWKAQLKTKKGGIIHRLGGESNSAVGSRYTMSLTQELSQSLILFARNSGHGLFATLAGAYALALKRMFNQNEFNIGTPMSGRLLNGMENLLGMFVNLYPIPIQFATQMEDENQSDTLMSEIRSWLADAIQFQDFPLKLVQTETAEEVNSSKFNVMFALQNMDISQTTILDDLNAIPIPFYDLPWNVAKFDLSLYSMEVGQSIILSFEYRTDVLIQADILQLSKTMEEILYKLPTRSIA